MKKKGAKKVITAIIALVLAAALCFAAVELVYYPRYKTNWKEVNIPDKNDGTISIISANVRTFAPGDLFKKSWFYRADLFLKSISEQTPDIIGFQEVTKMHCKYLADNLPDYDYVIEYRDKSLQPEACPVFYRTDKFECTDKGSFWLSNTPEKMSKDWGAMCYRICSYAILLEKDSGKKLVVFNTHLDHVSDEARINGIGVVLDKIKQFGSLPSIIMGDFNATEDSKTYKAATKNFDDAKYKTDKTQKGATYQGFGEALDSENIDYFMISKTEIKVNEYKIITKTYDGVYTSDHFPIYLNISL